MQGDDTRFLKLISSRLNMCAYKRLPHELKMEFNKSHLKFDESLRRKDSKSELEIAIRDKLLELADMLASKMDVREKPRKAEALVVAVDSLIKSRGE